jgi:hypothetical protein
MRIPSNYHVAQHFVHRGETARHSQPTLLVRILPGKPVLLKFLIVLFSFSGHNFGTVRAFQNIPWSPSLHPRPSSKLATVNNSTTRRFITRVADRKNLIRQTAQYKNKHYAYVTEWNKSILGAFARVAKTVRPPAWTSKAPTRQVFVQFNVGNLTTKVQRGRTSIALLFP